MNDNSSTVHCRISAVGIAIRLEIWRPRVRIPTESNIYIYIHQNVQTSAWATRPPIQWVTTGFIPIGEEAEVCSWPLIPQLQLSLRMSGAIFLPPPPQHDFTAWTEHTWLYDQFAPHREHNVRHFNQWILYRNITAVYCERQNIQIHYRGKNAQL